MNDEDECMWCDGTGNCPDCGGTGYEDEDELCEECGGNGSCPECDGDGEAR